jgi:hypothetical protein
MKLNYKNISASFAPMAFALIGFALLSQAANLSDQDKQFLAGYDKVHHALVAGAKKASPELGAAGDQLSKSKSLADARSAFSKLSGQAEKLAAGQSGYYVMHCPMKNADWVQTSAKVENPYGGKEMLTCGEVKK